MVMGARKYRFTVELAEGLREAYRAPNKRALSERLRALRRQRPAWPAHVWYGEAQRMGLAIEDRRPRWTAAEDRELLMGLGSRTVAWLARQLGRTRTAVEMRARRLEMSWRVRDGFTQQSLAECFGVMPAKVAQWVQMGSLTLCEGRITEEDVRRFIRLHPAEYDLRRVDQLWFKSMMTAGRTICRDS